MKRIARMADPGDCGGSARLVARVAALCTIVAVTSGCVALFPPDNSYRTNQDVLLAASQAAGFVVAPDRYEIERVEAESDSITFYYRGVDRPRAEAWVLRFTQKPAEQDPTMLEDVYSHLALIHDLRDEFQLGSETSETVDGARLRLAAYSFHSKVARAGGGQLPGQGVVATLAGTIAGRRAVFAMRLEVIGEEEALDKVDLAPFLDAILR